MTQIKACPPGPAAERPISSSTVILVAHGARELERALPFESIRDRLRAAGLTVELAFLEIMSPSLEEAAAWLEGTGEETVTIVPLFLAQGGHLKRDLPAMTEKIRKNHAKTEFRVTPALGEAPEIVAAISGWVQRKAR